ncbi:hypothetical protein D9756_001908 [Leucocoprinus leucothites]|uniref:UBC core domain-containing protein n=1 Tax=Leucocoprinus leucothites TaxID=201217 RepID=A0A8H5G519_9AGAR|nr:hypothetical protein D9756_001908 [Leucoagaricus leucothites]
MATLRRIQKEITDIKNNPIEGLNVEPQEDNLFEWKCTIKGASDSPYKGGSFNFNLSLPVNFPFKAPTVRHSYRVLMAIELTMKPGHLLSPHKFLLIAQVTFTTKIYHPGINEEGAICVPVLRDEWKPTVTLSSVLLTIKEKVNNPSTDDPFEPDIAAVLKNDKSKFNQTARDWIKKYASS